MFARRACRAATGGRREAAVEHHHRNTTTAGHARPVRVISCSRVCTFVLHAYCTLWRAVAFRILLGPRAEPPSNAWICELARQKKMGETPIILLPVVAPEPY